MTKPQFGYKYKPQASKLFQAPSLVDKQQDTIRSLASQEKNLTKRFNQAGQPLPEDSTGQLGLLAEITGEKSNTEVDTRNILEKALNLKPGQDTLMDILEVLDRPRQVISNMLSSLSNEDDRNILQAAWEGLAGRERISTKQALEKIIGGPILEDDPTGIGNLVLDIGLDILTDPTTYLGLGMITKPLGGAAKWIGKSIGELGEAALKSTNKVVRAFGQTVDGVKQVAKQGKFLFNAKADLPEWFIKELDKIDPGIGEKARKYKLTLTALRNQFAQQGPDAEKLFYKLFSTNSKLTSKGKVGFKLVTPDSKLLVKDVLETMFGNLKNKKITSFLLPGTSRQSTKNIRQLNRLVTELNQKVGRNVFRLKFAPVAGSINDADVALELFNNFSVNEFDELLKTLTAQKRAAGATLRKQVTFKGAQILDGAMDDYIKRVGVKTINENLATTQDITRKARELMSDMGKYKIGPEILEEGGRYARRVITAEAREFIAEKSPFVKQAFIQPGKDILTGRTFSNTLIESEINRAMKNLYGAKNNIFNESAIASLNDLINVSVSKYSQREVLKLVLGADVKRVGPGTKGLIVDKIRETNFFQPITDNTKAALAAQIPDSFTQLNKGSIKKEFSRLYNNLPEEFKAVWNKMLDVAGASGDTLTMHRSVYGVLKNLDNAYRELPDFIKNYDKFMGMWKEVNLISPAFNLRNLIGNSTNMYLSGMNIIEQTRYTTNAFFDLRKYDNLLKKQALDPYNLKNTLNVDEVRFVDEVGQFFREGISQSYKNTRDLDTVLKRLQDEAAGRIAKKKGFGKVYDNYVKANFKAAENIDNMQRYAMWKWAKDAAAKVSPGSPDNSFKAAQKVREALFDYTSLTPFEKDYMKRLIPFYTFMKNNLVFQAKNITKMPQQYTKMLRAYKYWGEDIAGLKQEDMPDYMSGNMWIPIPLTIDAGDTDKIAFLKANLPIADFAEFIENPIKKGVSGITVPIKLLWELGSERELFTGAPIEKFPGEKSRMEDPDNKVILNEIRGKNGEIYLSGDPTIQKIADELGLRTPRRLASAILDVLDTATGAQSTDELITDIFEKSGITDTKTRSELELNALYQRVEKLRNLKKLYEQNIGELPFVEKPFAKQQPLPGSNLPNRAQYLYKPK
jgi:hypothetical protein